MCCWRWAKEPKQKTNIKNPQRKPKGLWQSDIHIYVNSLAKKMHCFAFRKCELAFGVIEFQDGSLLQWFLSRAMSSTMLTQFPEDGELAWFNHPFTHHSDDLTHTGRREVHGRSIVTAFSPHYNTIPLPPPQLLHFPTELLFLFVDISSSWRKDT